MSFRLRLLPYAPVCTSCRNWAFADLSVARSVETRWRSPLICDLIACPTSRLERRGRASCAGLFPTRSTGGMSEPLLAHAGALPLSRTIKPTATPHIARCEICSIMITSFSFWKKRVGSQPLQSASHCSVENSLAGSGSCRCATRCLEGLFDRAASHTVPSLAPGRLTSRKRCQAARRTSTILALQNKGWGLSSSSFLCLVCW